MKSLLKTAILLSFVSSLTVIPSFCADTVQVNIYFQQVERNIDNKGIEMMKKIGKRQWVSQNETAMKVNFQNDVINALKQGNYDKAIEYCHEGLNYQKYVSTNYYYYIGLAYLMKKDYVNAIKNYNIAIKNYKKEQADIFYERGLARLHIQDYDGAIEDYNKAISLGLNFDEPFLNGNEKYNYTNNVNNVQNKDFDILDYFILPQMDKFGKLAFLSEGIKKNEFQSIENFYTEKIKNNYKLAETYNNRGVYYLENQDYQRAFNDFQESLKHNKNLKETYFNLALYYYAKFDFINAKQNLEKFEELQIQIKENYSVGKLGTSKSQFYSERDKFIDIMLKANIELKLRNFATSYEIYDKFKVNNFFEDSLSYKYATDLLPLIEGKAYQYITTKKYKKAINFLSSILTADYYPQTGQDYAYRGKYFYLFTPANEPTIDFSKGYPVLENAYIFSNIALLEYLMGKNDLAIENIKKAKEISFNFNDIELYTNIIKTYNYINTSK